MKKSIYLISGFILAVIGTIGLWVLNKEPQPAEPVKKEAKKVSLYTINYIPLTPAKPVEEGKYWEIEKDADTEPVEKDIKDLKGKPVILHFWATWCGPCVQELPALDTFARKYAKGAHILAVATDMKDIPKIRAFYKTKGIQHLKINFDKSGLLSRSFSPAALPTTVFINSNGEEIGRIAGMVEWDGLAGRLLNTYLNQN